MQLRDGCPSGRMATSGPGRPSFLRDASGRRGPSTRGTSCPIRSLPVRVLAAAEVLPTLRDAIASMATAVEDYIIDRELPGGGSEFAVILATDTLRRLYKSWDGSTVTGLSKVQKRAFLPRLVDLPAADGRGRVEFAMMDDGDFYEKYGEPLATQERLEALRTILDEASPAARRRRAAADAPRGPADRFRRAGVRLEEIPEARPSWPRGIHGRSV